MIESLLAAPALLKILGAFAAVLCAARLKLNLGLAMLLGALVLGLWSGLPADRIAGSIWGSVTQSGTWPLMLLVGLIVCFGKALQLSGRLDRVVHAVVARTGSRRWAAALLPALVGFLPMPGGAYLSAPMVESAAREDKLSPERLCAINYWFRHLWEYWWPLYPGVIVGVGTLEKEHPGRVNLGWFMLFEAPLTLAVLGGGALFLLGRSYAKERKRNGAQDALPADPAVAVPRLWGELFPILLVVGLTLLWSALEVAAQELKFTLPRIPKGLPLAAFVFLGTLVVIRRNRLGAPAARRIFLQPKAAYMAFIILGVMAFQRMIKDSGGVAGMSADLDHLGIPPLILVGLLPFVAGLVTGIAVGFAGAAFPVVAALMPREGGHIALASYYVLAFGAGYAGMMLSPVHFCLVLTREYFQAPLARIYRLLAGPTLVLILGTAALSALYRLLS